MKMTLLRICLVSLAITCVAFSVQAQTTLSPGDLAIIGVNADGSPGPNYFSFVLLKDIEAGTQIYFTDRGWSDDGFWPNCNPSESNPHRDGIVLWTAPTDIDSCTIINWTYEGGTDFEVQGVYDIDLMTSGDQVIAYQGPHFNAPAPFIFAVQTNSTQRQGASNCDHNQSALPPGLTDGVNAVAVGEDSGGEDEWDNSVYNDAVTTGFPQEILAAIANADNWNGADDSIPLSREDGDTTTFHCSSSYQGEGEGVPTLSQWGLMILGLCLSVIGLVAVRRRIFKLG